MATVTQVARSANKGSWDGGRMMCCQCTGYSNIRHRCYSMCPPRGYSVAVQNGATYCRVRTGEWKRQKTLLMGGESTLKTIVDFGAWQEDGLALPTLEEAKNVCVFAVLLQSGDPEIEQWLMQKWGFDHDSCIVPWVLEVMKRLWAVYTYCFRHWYEFDEVVDSLHIVWKGWCQNSVL